MGGIVSLVSNEEKSLRVWRYISLDKFLMMLSGNYLYFSKLLEMEDPHEGITTGKDRNLYSRMAMFNYKGYEEDGFSTLPDPGTYIKDFIDFYDSHLIHNYYVSCWHINESESMGMWDLYSGQGKGIAISSTIGKLENKCGLNGKNSYFSGIVRYGEDGDSLDSIHARVFRKREAFKHENEYRLIIYRDNIKIKLEDQPLGLLEEVDAIGCIDEILLGPRTPMNLVDAINNILLKFEVKIEAKRSKILDY